MRPFRRTPPDRRAARLLAMTASCGDRTETVAINGLDALRRVVAAYGAERLLGRGEAREADRALRLAVSRLVHEGRARDPLRAERLLIELRHAWGELPEVRALSEDGVRGALWDRLVHLCCEEFYAPASSAVASAVRGDTARA